jgi:membrane protein required for colicin V production
MFIDAIAFVFLLLAVFKGWRKGFVIAVFSFLGFIAGLIAALELSAWVASLLEGRVQIGARWLPVIAFILVFIGTLLLVRLGAKALEGMLDLVMLGWLNKLAGILLYASIYAIIFSVLLFYATQLNLVTADAKDNSATYAPVSSLAPAVFHYIGIVLPFIQDAFSELRNYFQQLPQSRQQTTEVFNW